MVLDARERNLLIKIVNWAIENSCNIEESLEKIEEQFTKEDIRSKLFFKKSDVKKYYERLFEDNGFIKSATKDKLALYVRKHYNCINTDSEKLKQIYEELSKQFENYHLESENIQKTLVEAAEIAEKNHWKYMPVYKEEYIINNDYIPEDNPRMYYNHYHAIEDLYRYIYTEDKMNWKSTDGDLNLGVELTFKIYTTRWGHYDYHSIKRTEDGWELRGLPASSGYCAINGIGALTDALRHDSVCYPKAGLEYAMEILWNEADKTEMKCEILQNRLNDISEWIKAVEIATHEAQPEWCGYY